MRALIVLPRALLVSGSRSPPSPPPIFNSVKVLQKQVFIEPRFRWWSTTVEHRGSSNCHHSPDLGRRFRARLADLMRSLDGPISSPFVGVERKRQASCLGGDESNRAGHLDHSANRLRSKSSRVPGLGAFAFEGARARSRNKDGKNVPNATTAFKTVACLNVTLGHAKIG
jgi:hypothetical protein